MHEMPQAAGSRYCICAALPKKKGKYILEYIYILYISHICRCECALYSYVLIIFLISFHGDMITGRCDEGMKGDSSMCRCKTLSRFMCLGGIRALGGR